MPNMRVPCSLGRISKQVSSHLEQFTQGLFRKSPVFAFFLNSSCNVGHACGQRAERARANALMHPSDNRSYPTEKSAKRVPNKRNGCTLTPMIFHNPIPFLNSGFRYNRTAYYPTRAIGRYVKRIIVRPGIECNPGRCAATLWDANKIHWLAL